jgi:tetrahydromethanopterin S-methyltransferase subunit C
MSNEAPEAREDRAIRTALILGPILSCVGIAWTAMDPSTLSSSAVLMGIATCVWGTHRYGRQGADEGPPDEPATRDATGAP